MFNADELKEIYRRLAEPFPEEAIERTSGAITHKGYDTTGYKYIHVVNRLNDVLGVGGFRVDREFTVREKSSKNGAILFDVTCDLVVQLGRWVDGKFVVFAEACGTGGHVAATAADAKKGSYTNGFKKTVAMFGCGWQSYAGCIDDDNVPASGSHVQPQHQRDDRRNWNGNGRQQGKQQNDSNGRITTAQLERLRVLVAEVGGDWGRYRDHVRGEHRVNVEYADRRLADQLIASLIATAEKRKGNGAHASGRSP